jgi:hypothetical protein
MAQGTIKVKKSAAPAKRSSALGPKKGARTIAPRKIQLVKNAKMTKVCLFPTLPLALFLLPFPGICVPACPRTSPGTQGEPEKQHG